MKGRIVNKNRLLILYCCVIVLAISTREREREVLLDLLFIITIDNATTKKYFTLKLKMKK